MNTLEKIVKRKKQEVEVQRSIESVDALQMSDKYKSPCKSTRERLIASDAPAIIAEFKRKSPSKGVINDQADVVRVAHGYEDAGASAVSILTDHDFFGGNIEDIQRVKININCPILRKDFVIDEYQIYETKALGADLILLIAAILTKEEVKKFTQIAQKIGLEVLLEIHSEEEFKSHYIEQIDILGVNNRDLKNFQTNITTSLNLAAKLPDQQTKISESGISSIDDIDRLTDVGFDGFLIGEQFMKHADPAQELKRFLYKEIA